jgi:hypothetical protein
MTNAQKQQMINTIRMQFKMVIKALEHGDIEAATIYEGRAVDSFKWLLELNKRSEQDKTKTYVNYGKIKLVA